MKNENDKPIVETFLPKETANFKPGELPKSKDAIGKANSDILKVQIADYKWRVDSRGPICWTILGILISQNLLVFILVFLAFFYDNLKDLQIIFSSFFAGTLAETYLTLNYVVKWLFNNVDYKLHPNEPSPR